MFDVPPFAPKPIFEQANEWQPYLIDDFTGGLDTADPSTALRKDQFSAMSNYYLQPNRTLKVRGPFRPWLVASEDTILPDTAPPLTFKIVELRGSDFMVACWNSGSYTEVSVYDETNDRWAGEVAGTSIKANLTDGYPVRFAKFGVNDAEDLLFCNGKDTPQRWVGTVDTASSDLGLKVPSDMTLTITNVSAANPGVVTTSAVHGLTNNDVVAIDGVVGDMGDDVLNDNAFTITVVTTTTFSIGASTAGKTYTSDGTVHKRGLVITAASTVGGRGIITNGTFYYKMTYFYDDSGTSTKYGESGPTTHTLSVAVTGAAAGAEQKVTLLGFTFPTGVASLNLYRAPPDTPLGPYELVGEGILTETDFDDVVPVGEEGVECPLDAGTPPKLKNPMVHDGRLWGIGINAAGALTNKGVWSRKGSPDFFNTFDFAYFPDPLVGPVAFKKDVYWFTEQQIYVVPNADVVTYANPLKICDIGCDSFDSIVDVGNGLVWQYNGNIYWANFNDFNPVTGDLPWPIGDPIRDKIEDIPVAQRVDSNGTFHHDRYYLSIAGPNQFVPTSTLVWDVKHGTRLLQKGQTGAWSSLSWAANDMQSFDETLYTADNTNKYIMEHDFAGTADYTSKTNYDATTSNDIATELATGDLHFGDEWADKIINSLSLMVQTSGITLNAVISFNDNEYRRTKSFTLGSGSLAIDSTWLIWGQGTWGNFNWGSSAYGVQSDHKKTGKGGKGRNAKLTLESSDSEDTNLIMAKIYFKALPVVA